MAVSTGQWYYVAATYDAASGTQTIYVNGAAERTVSQPAGNTVVPLTGYSNMYIGYSTSTPPISTAGSTTCGSTTGRFRPRRSTGST